MQNIDAGGLAIFLAQLVFVGLIVERCVAQCKKLRDMDISKPWPMVATAISGAIVFGSGNLPLIPTIAPGVEIVPFIDQSLLTLWLAGGASGIVATVKDFKNKRNEIHKAKIT